MIKLHPKYVTGLRAATTLEELLPYVQNAIELEHATIPPYLTAMYSLKRVKFSLDGHKIDENKPEEDNNEFYWQASCPEVFEIIHSVVVEEMLHMSIACNIMNALGGSPDINNPHFVPEYPSALPMGIGEDEGHPDEKFVTLAKYSKQQVHDVFMKIEEPEKPIDLPNEDDLESFREAEFHTIGQFYDALKKKIIELAPACEPLPGDASKQVTSPAFSKDLLFPIITPENAAAAIDIIVEQGEGTENSITTEFDFEKEIAHYYRFEELYVGKRLVKDPRAEHGYAFSNKPENQIICTEDDVWNIYPDTKAAMFAEGTAERIRVDEFNASYHSLLDGLHQTFNGHPQMLDGTIGLMYDIKLYAEKLCATPFPGKEGYYIGPSFEFTKKQQEFA